MGLAKLLQNSITPHRVPFLLGSLCIYPPENTVYSQAQQSKRVLGIHMHFVKPAKEWPVTSAKIGPEEFAKLFRITHFRLGVFTDSQSLCVYFHHLNREPHQCEVYIHIWQRTVTKQQNLAQYPFDEIRGLPSVPLFSEPRSQLITKASTGFALDGRGALFTVTSC